MNINHVSLDLFARSGFYAIVDISLEQPTHISNLQKKTMVNNLCFNSHYREFLNVHFYNPNEYSREEEFILRYISILLQSLEW